MKSDAFERIFNHQIKLCENVLVNKAVEYADDTDRLHNFKTAAALEDTTPQEALAGMMAKHTVSIYDMCRYDADQFTMDQWEEKITDHMNYLILLKAVIFEGIYEDVSQLEFPTSLPHPRTERSIWEHDQANGEVRRS
jgi:hypothetical protein